MEREISMVLVQTGATDEEAAYREMDELAGKQLSIEEIRQKQAELAQVKARLFYEQMRRHRVNKIKSKAFHRIKKRQRQRSQTQQEELDQQNLGDSENATKSLEEKATKRIKERMDLRHKNTTKWARMALEHGRGDKSLK